MDYLPGFMIDDEVNIKFMQEEIKIILKDLPDKERQVVEYKFFAELSNNEIAQIMKISANNVGVILFRALKKCKANIK